MARIAGSRSGVGALLRKRRPSSESLVLQAPSGRCDEPGVYVFHRARSSCTLIACSTPVRSALERRPKRLRSRPLLTVVN